MQTKREPDLGAEAGRRLDEFGRDEFVEHAEALSLTSPGTARARLASRTLATSAQYSALRALMMTPARVRTVCPGRQSLPVPGSARRARHQRCWRCLPAPRLSIPAGY
jgi:hypothetical protein